MGSQQERFEAAVESFVEKVKGDPNVIAVVLYGSVAAGTAWEKSDVDITVVVRDQRLDNNNYGIYEDNITFGVDICTRSELKRHMEKSLAGSVGHSINSTSKIVFTRDDSLYEYFEDNKRIGKADMERTIFNLTDWLLGTMDKIEKWLVVKNDAAYAQYYVLTAAQIIAQIEVVANFEIPTREAILQATAINPGLMNTFYLGPMSRAMSEDEIYGLLKQMNDYVESHMDKIKSVVTDFFGDGDIKTGTMVTKHFNSDMGMHGMHPMMDFLCGRGILEKVSQTIRITPKSKLSVEEVAFIMIT